MSSKVNSTTGICIYGCKDNDHDALIVKRMLDDLFGGPSDEQKERDRDMLARRMYAEMKQEIKESEAVEVV
jgi:hypothetical protein